MTWPNYFLSDLRLLCSLYLFSYLFVFIYFDIATNGLHLASEIEPCIAFDISQQSAQIWDQSGRTYVVLMKYETAFSI